MAEIIKKAPPARGGPTKNPDIKALVNAAINERNVWHSVSVGKRSDTVRSAIQYALLSHFAEISVVNGEAYLLVWEDQR